jgi:hypothetical protein
MGIQKIYDHNETAPYSNFDQMAQPVQLAILRTELLQLLHIAAVALLVRDTCFLSNYGAVGWKLPALVRLPGD